MSWKTLRFSIYNLTLRTKSRSIGANIRLPVAVRGSKTSVLRTKLSITLQWLIFTCKCENRLDSQPLFGKWARTHALKISSRRGLVSKLTLIIQSSCAECSSTTWLPCRLSSDVRRLWKWATNTEHKRTLLETLTLFNNESGIVNDGNV